MAKSIIKNRIPSSLLFLMELLLSLLLFAIAAAASLSVFARAHNMSEEAYSTAIAAEDLSSMSELIRRGSDYVDVMDRAATEYPHAEMTADSIIVYFDKENRETDKDNAAFQMCALFSMQDSMMHADMGFSSDPEAGIEELVLEAASLYASAESEEEFRKPDGLTAFLSIDHYVKEGEL